MDESVDPRKDLNDLIGESKSTLYLDIVDQDLNAEMFRSEESDPINQCVDISKHFIALLEDYRYILNCFMETCSCHTNFDHQFFVKKMEERYSKLADLVSSNPDVANILQADNAETFEQFVEKRAPKIKKNHGDDHKFIKRVRICERPKKQPPPPPPAAAAVRYDEEMPLDDNGDYLDLPEFDLSIKGTKIAYKCIYPKCGFISFNQDDLSDHIKNHGSFLFRKSDMDKRDVVYICDQCGKEFAGQKWLNNHVENVHTFAKIYSCDFVGCSYQSKFRCVIEDHKRRHCKTKEFKCIWEGCESEFVTKRDMIAHVNFYHKGIRNYACSWPNCEATFKDSNRLKHHLYTHTGERPYKCDHPGCEASFKQQPHLYKHKRVHKMMDGEEDDEAGGGGGGGDDDLDPGIFKCRYYECNDSKFLSEEDLVGHMKQVHHEDEQYGAVAGDTDTHGGGGGGFGYRCVAQDCDHLFTNREDLDQHLIEKHSIRIKTEDQ